MKKKIFIPILIASLAAVWASRKPDGLDQVAQTLGFADKGVERSAVMAGYEIPWIGNSIISTVFAGVAGVLIVYLIFALWLKLRASSQKADC